jgi:hypothetical protein
VQARTSDVWNKRFDAPRLMSVRNESSEDAYDVGLSPISLSRHRPAAIQIPLLQQGGDIV